MRIVYHYHEYSGTHHLPRELLFQLLALMTDENTHGFKNRKIILVPRVEYEDEKSSEPIIERVVLEEDDAFHYIHDNDKIGRASCRERVSRSV